MTKFIGMNSKTKFSPTKKVFKAKIAKRVFFQRAKKVVEVIALICLNTKHGFCFLKKDVANFYPIA